MRSRYIPAGVILAFVGSVAMAQTSSTTSSTTGNSTGTITQSGGGVTTKKIIKGKDSQTIIQQQGNSSAAITQGAAAVPDSGPVGTDIPGLGSVGVPSVGASGPAGVPSVGASGPAGVPGSGTADAGSTKDAAPAADDARKATKDSAADASSTADKASSTADADEEPSTAEKTRPADNSSDKKSGETCVEAGGVSVCAPAVTTDDGADATDATGGSPELGAALQRRAVPHATSPRRAERLAESRARRGGSVDRKSAYEKRVERQFGFEINPSPEFRRLFLDKLR